MSSDSEKEHLQEILQKEGELGESDRKLLVDIKNQLDKQDSQRRNKFIMDNIFWLIFVILVIVIISLLVWAFNHRL
ncbi:MAG: hypothetical protein ACTSSN_09750 [Candidatus Heimdallarchaeaceae archaeon]